ncbi:MAG: hypothetical protein KDJ38_03815 [Gammaproteobacteria bacterium]|nr:hypothetical protein [Gammaproteobacteria bacterium]
MLNNLDNISERIFYIPSWVRWTGFLLIFLSFASAVAAFVLAFTGVGEPSWIDPALSIIQMSGVGALGMLIVFFVERAHSAPKLAALTERFLTHDIPQNLLKIDHELGHFQEWNQQSGGSFDELQTRTQLRISYNKGSYTAYYIVTAYTGVICLMVEANVKRFNTVFICNNPTECSPGDFFQRFADTLGGAANAGYHVGEPYTLSAPRTQLPQGIDWQKCVAVPLHQNKEKDYMYSTPERAHVVQDLAVMVRAFIREGVEEGLILPSN